MRSLIYRQLIFTLSLVACGGLTAAGAYKWVGPAAVEGVVFSVLLCLVPGWLTMFTSGLLKNRSLAIQLVVLGSVHRMLFALVGWIAVGVLRPDLGFYEFTVWLIPIYMVAIALETWLVLLPAPADAV